MIRFSSTLIPSTLAFIGALSATMIANGTTAGAGDIIDTARVIPSADRCTAYGPDAVNLGNGICGRLGARTRIEVHSRNANAQAWTVYGTSSANLRSDGIGGMVPGANAAQHLRVRSGLDSYNPFR